MLKEFKAFILRGTVLDLAVGVIIGGAFTAIVKSLVDNLINPLIGIFVQDGALAQLSFKLGIGICNRSCYRGRIRKILSRAQLRPLFTV